MNKSQAQLLVNKTKDDYNLIADRFDQTRGYLPADILSVAGLAVDGDKVLDAGCGNGRLSACFASTIEYVGVDNSSALINIAKQKYPSGTFRLIDSLEHLDFADGFFDKVYCLAVFHHIPSANMRMDVLKELSRVLKNGGKLFLTVWDLTDRSDFANLVRQSKSDINADQFDENDLLVPFSSPNGKVWRYVHQFSETELTSLLTKSGFVIDSVSHTHRGKKAGQGNLQFNCRKH